MITSLQNALPVGVPNPLQEQANSQQARDDIRTNNAEQLALRNVENAKEGKDANPLGGKMEEKVKEEEKKKAPPMVPPPPTRFQSAVQERQDQLRQTQAAVVQYFLTAVTNPLPGQAQEEAARRQAEQMQDRQAEQQIKGVDVTV